MGELGLIEIMLKLGRHHDKNLIFERQIQAM